jgi:hypothetical protein
MYYSDRRSRLALLVYLDQQIAEGESLLLEPLSTDDVRRVVDQVARYRRIRARVCEQLAGEFHNTAARSPNPETMAASALLMHEGCQSAIPPVAR